MDGASRFQKIVHIDIPHLIPIMVVLLILRAGGLLSVGFEKSCYFKILLIWLLVKSFRPMFIKWGCRAFNIAYRRLLACLILW